MTERGNFILRWARLKRASDTGHKADRPAGNLPESTQADVASAQVTVAQPRIDVAADVPPDPASLPSVDAISAITDVRGFLQSHVPAELTRAALRKVWTCDPAIRDFIGIAENQWDFNDPDATPGFGPLPADNLPGLTQALGRHDEPAKMTLEMPASVEQLFPAATGHERTDLDQRKQKAFSSLPMTGDGLRGLPTDGSEDDRATRSNRVDEGNRSSRNHRPHGSATPR
jgi:hypothetical protein